MNECACCAEVKADMRLTACLKTLCALCLEDMKAVEPRTCVFCQEKDCLEQTALQSASKNDLPELAVCAVHNQNIRWMCVTCDVLCCFDEDCMPSKDVRPNTEEDSFKFLALQADHVAAQTTYAKECLGHNYITLMGGPPKWLVSALKNRHKRLESLYNELHELCVLVQQHKEAQMDLLLQAFAGCSKQNFDIFRRVNPSENTCAGCDLCPTADEIHQRNVLGILMDTCGAADGKALNHEKCEVTEQMRQIEQVLHELDLLNVPLQDAETWTTITMRAVLVCRRAVTLLRTPEQKAPHQAKISVVCAPRPFGHRTRKCISVNRLVLRRRHGLACLDSRKTFFNVEGIEARGVFEYQAEDTDLLITPASENKPAHRLALHSNVKQVHCNPPCIVYARLPDGSLVGLAKTTSTCMKKAVVCANAEAGAVIWTKIFDEEGDANAVDLIVSPDGIVVITIYKYGTHNRWARLMALLPDGTLHWLIDAEVPPHNLCMVDREHFAYTERSCLVLFVHNVYTGDFSHQVDAPKFWNSQQVWREKWPCHADAHVGTCQGGPNGELARRIHPKGHARPMFHWSENGIMLPFYLHDGRVLQHEDTHLTNTFQYSIRQPQKNLE